MLNEGLVKIAAEIRLREKGESKSFKGIRIQKLSTP